jgi:hypothetical protein
MRWVFGVCLITIGIMVGYLIIDAGARLFLSSKATRFDLVAGTSNSRVLFVYLPGILADGPHQSKELLPVLTQYGDVLQVSYMGQRFDGTRVVADLEHELRTQVNGYGYRTVVFIGASMGALVAYDTFQKVRTLPVTWKFVVMDAPTGRRDLQPPLDKLILAMNVWYPGPIANLLHRPIMNMMAVPPKEENIEQQVDRAELAKRVQEAKSFSPSFLADEDRFILNHSPLKKNSLEGKTIVYVRSTRDNDTVRPRAFNTWKQVAAGGTIRLEVDSTHVGFNERPETWRQAFANDIIPALGLD